MRRLSRVLVEFEGEPAFWCPGCGYMHRVWVRDRQEGNGALWGWDGNVDRPTFTPSILVRGSEMTKKGRADYEAWRASGFPSLAGRPGFEFRDTVCHSFVTDGQIQFLNDSTHALSGQTVPLPDWPIEVDP